MPNTKINLIYPGSFDPFHRGHTDIIRRLHEHFDEPVNLIVLLQPNRFKKSSMFDMDFKFNFLEENIKYLFSGWDISVKRTEEKSFSMYWHITNLCSQEYMLVVGDDTLNTIHKWDDFNLMVEHGLQIVVMQRELSYKEISNFKDTLPIHSIISHDKESIEQSFNMSSTYVREQILEIIKQNMYKRIP